jgi:hypothetical protein
MSYHSLENIVEEKFDTIFNEAKLKAENDFKGNYLAKIENLPLFEKFKFVTQQKERIKEVLETVNPFYSEAPDNYDSLLKIFAARVILLNYDESNDLFTGIYTSFLRNQLFDLYHELTQKIPKYSYEDFINNKFDPYYLELEYLYHLTEDDYYKIKEWQSNKLLEIVGLESSLMIARLQEGLNAEIHPKKLLQNQKELFDNHIHRQTCDDVSELIAVLKKFVFLEGYNFNQLNNPETLTDFNQFNKDEIFWGKMHPTNINLVRKQYLTNKKNAFTPSYMLFFSINKVIVWIEQVLETGNYFVPFVYPDLQLVFSDTMKKAPLEAQNKIVSLEKGFSQKKKSEKKLFIFNVLEQLRHEVNQKEFFRYYYQILDNVTVLENLFVTNAFLDNNIEAHVNYLLKAFALKECIYHFWFLWEDLTGQIQIALEDDHSKDFLEVIQLSNSMPFDINLKKRIGEILHNTMEDFSIYHLPMDFISRNTEEQMKEVFFDSLENLSTYFKTSPHKNKMAYLYSKLKELKKRQLELKRYSEDINFNYEATYTNLFKEYLEIEAEYVEKTKDLDFIPILNNLTSEKLKALPGPQKKFSFGIKPVSISLVGLVKQLCLQVDFLNNSITTPEDLVEVLSAKDIINFKKEIHFGCNTNQLSYIVDKLKPWFKNLNPTTMTNSGLFFTKSGTPLQRQNLYANKVLSQPKRARIDNIFKQFQ